MRKIGVFFLIAFICLMSAPNAKAQKGFTPNNLYVDLGIGFPRYTFGFWGVNTNYNYYRLPALRANIEYGFDMFSIGGFASYSHYGWKYKDTYHWTENGSVHTAEGNFNDRHSYIGFGVRFSWHIWYFLNHKLDLGLGVEGLDLYASAMSGPVINRDTYRSPTNKTTQSDVRFYFGVVAGAKYYFSNNFGVFLEVGYSPASYATGGVSFKF